MTCCHTLVVFIDSTAKDIFLFGKMISFKEDSKMPGSFIRMFDRSSKTTILDKTAEAK